MRPLATPARALARIAMQVDAMPQPPLRPTRYPVVLMHGFGAVAGALPGGALHAEAMHLRARGVWAYAPTVNPYDTVAVRAHAWAERLERVLAETGAERLNLVAFSSGGLDARHLATELGWADRLASIVTVATPHAGTALAQFVLDRPERLRGWAVGIMDFFGRAAYDAASALGRGARRALAGQRGAALRVGDGPGRVVRLVRVAGRQGHGRVDVPAARRPEPRPARPRRASTTASCRPRAPSGASTSARSTPTTRASSA